MSMTFKDLTLEKVSGILNSALDKGEWHSPGTHDIEILDQSNDAVYGFCKASLHNQYWDRELWFEIRVNSVHIWEKMPDKKNQYLRIYNLQTLAKVLAEYEAKKEPANNN